MVEESLLFFSTTLSYEALIGLAGLSNLLSESDHIGLSCPEEVIVDTGATLTVDAGSEGADVSVSASCGGSVIFESPAAGTSVFGSINMAFTATQVGVLRFNSQVLEHRGATVYHHNSCEIRVVSA